MITFAHVGFTGSRRGLTPEQRPILVGALRDLRSRWGATTLHEGDCIGCDAEATEIAKELGYRIVSHPPLRSTLRAFVPADEVRTPKPYLARDRDIVDEAAVLIGCPSEDRERRGSGTWYTIGYARQAARYRVVIAPDGRFLDTYGFGWAGAAS